MMNGAGEGKKIYPPVKIATVLDALRGEGLPAEAAIDGLGLSPAQTQSPATRVSLDQVLKAYAAAASLSADPHFAYRAGLRLHVTAYGMYGFAILSSTNFRRSIEFAIAYYELATPVVAYDFHEESGLATWAFTPWRTRAPTPASRNSSSRCNSAF